MRKAVKLYRIGYLLVIGFILFAAPIIVRKINTVRRDEFNDFLIHYMDNIESFVIISFNDDNRAYNVNEKIDKELQAFLFDFLSEAEFKNTKERKSYDIKIQFESIQKDKRLFVYKDRDADFVSVIFTSGSMNLNLTGYDENHIWD